MTRPNGTVKFALLAFVFLSAGAVVYKAAIAPAKTPAKTAGGPSAAAGPVRTATESGSKIRPVARPAPVSRAGEKAAVVYYFHTDTRCSSCRTLETYTREAVAARLAAGHKGWEVEFRGVNLDEAGNEHFIRDYRLDSKSVVVQKFSGNKSLAWRKLDKVWRLLGDKDAFTDYVAEETRGFLDEK